MTLLLYISFPILCVLAISQSSCNGSFAVRLVFGIALYEFILLVIGTLLGLTNHLAIVEYNIVTWCLAIPLGIKSWKNGIRNDQILSMRWLRTRRGTTLYLLTALLSITFALQLAFDSFFGTMHYDGLWYHIPRIIFWLQQHNFDAWPTPVFGQIGIQTGADVVLGQKIFLGMGWRGIGYVNIIISVGAIVAVYLVALDMGLTRWHAAMAAILFGSFPAIGLRIWCINTDMAAAFPLLASHVALHRIRATYQGFSVFALLIGTAIACKISILFYFPLFGFTIWKYRHKISKIQRITLPCVAVFFAVTLIYSSFLPVYLAFYGLPEGDANMPHKVATVKEFNHATAMHYMHWLLEPLGYLAPIPKLQERVNELAKIAYNSIGEEIEKLPKELKPKPQQDTGRSGLASILFIPVLIYGLSPKVRIPALLVCLIGFVPLSGFFHFRPWYARYTIILLAGYAVLWCGTGLFRHGCRRWLLTVLVALNVCALLGVVIVEYTWNSHQDGSRSYGITAGTRDSIARATNGRPLLVIANESMDALLVGPSIAYPLQYIICPNDSDWVHELRTAATKSNRLALVHDGRKTLYAGPSDWHRPGSNLCPEVTVSSLEEALVRAGWRRFQQYPKVDLWRSS